MKQTATTTGTSLLVATFFAILSVTSIQQATALNQPLPITSILPGQEFPCGYGQLSATVTNNRVNISWLSNIVDADGVFEVERSTHNGNFKTIGLVLDGFEEGTAKKSYRFRDNIGSINNLSHVQYRLKQVATNGTVTYSEVLHVTLPPAIPAAAIKVSPNPVKESVTIDFDAANAANVEVRILSPMGVGCVSKTVSVTKGTNRIFVEGLASLPRGIYVAQLVIDGTAVSSQKIIKN